MRFGVNRVKAFRKQGWNVYLPGEMTPWDVVPQKHLGFVILRNGKLTTRIFLATPAAIEYAHKIKGGVK